MQPIIRFDQSRASFSDAMPDIRQAADWVALPKAMKVAAERNRPIVAVVAASWSTGAHLVSAELTTSSVQQVMAEQFIPVHIDPVASPALTGKIAAMAQYQMGNGALPLLAILSLDGNPVLATHYTAPEHRDATTPSIEGLLSAVAEQWSTDPAPFANEWKQATTALESNDDGLDRDMENGGYLEATKQLRPYQLATHASESADDPWLLHTLSLLWNRGVRDQLEASFHAGSRDAIWVIPYFEKLIPQNAAMALAYASAARQSKSREIRSQAQDLVRFCLNAFLQGTDVISGESHYYTWLSTELYDAVSRENLQTVALFHNVQPKVNRQVLGPVRSIAEVAAFGYDAEDTITTRILAGHAEMLMHRRTRPTPRPITMENLAWRSESYRWLLLAMETLGSSDISLLTNAFAAWVSGIWPSDHEFNAPSDEQFQGAVSLLNSLLLARTRIKNDDIERLWPDVLSAVSQGIEFWKHADAPSKLWLSKHRDLPSVTSTLQSIRSLLPEGYQLPDLD